MFHKIVFSKYYEKETKKELQVDFICVKKGKVLKSNLNELTMFTFWKKTIKNRNI